MQAAPPPMAVASVQAEGAAELPRIQIGCPQVGSGDVVVCGRRTASRYRLQPLPALPVQPIAMERLRDRMTLHIGSATLGPGCSGRCAGISLRVPS